MLKPKISLIGAGSVVFAKNLISDILQFPELSDVTLSLMDIDPQRLKLTEEVARLMVQKLKSKATIEATLSQKESIKDAHFVICTVQVGGYKPATVDDFEIPKKYGLFQTIGDTLGIGGIFRGLRTIPVLTSIAKDIEAVGAPGCLLLNYSNPMAMNCWAVSEATQVPCVGLCHSVQGTSLRLANYLKLPYEDVSYLVAGINHMAFFLKFEYRKQDAYPLLFKLLEDKNFHEDRVRFEMMRRTGYFVTESSHHQCEYTPYFIHHGREVLKEFDIPIDEYLRRCEAGIASWKSTEKNLLGKNGDIPIQPQTHEYGSYIIHSCLTNKPRVVYGNVSNRGLITNLPEGACVEVPCLVDGNGVKPVVVGDLPPQLAAICRTNINVQELTVKAALTRRREHIYHAAMLDPHTSATLTLEKIWQMCDELIEAHQKNGFMGEYEKTIPNTGKTYAGTADRIVSWLEFEGTEPKTNSLQFNVVVQNPRARPETVEFFVKYAGPSFEKDGEFSTRMTAAAGKETVKLISVPYNHQIELVGSIDLVPTRDDVFAQGFTFHKRTTIQLSENNEAPFKLILDGVDAVHGRLKTLDDAIEVEVTVNDSNINPSEIPWLGSSVELFFAANERAEVHQIFSVPSLKQKAPVFYRLTKPEQRVIGNQKVARHEYSVVARVPYESIGFEKAPETFLFDVIANISALGDAHGGGRTSTIAGKVEHHIKNFVRISRKG